MIEKVRKFIKETIDNNSAYKLTSFHTECDMYEEGIEPIIEFYKKHSLQLSGKKVVDLGAGSGIFGISLLIMDEKLDITFVERSKRKAYFIEYILSKLGLNGEVKNMDAKDIEERFDIALVRSFTGSIKVIRRILKPGAAVYILMKGKSKFEEYIEKTEVIEKFKLGMFHIEHKNIK